MTKEGAETVRLAGVSIDKYVFLRKPYTFARVVRRGNAVDAALDRSAVGSWKRIDSR